MANTRMTFGVPVACITHFVVTSPGQFLAPTGVTFSHSVRPSGPSVSQQAFISQCHSVSHQTVGAKVYVYASFHYSYFITIYLLVITLPEESTVVAHQGVGESA